MYLAPILSTFQQEMCGDRKNSNKGHHVSRKYDVDTHFSVECFREYMLTGDNMTNIVEKSSLDTSFVTRAPRQHTVKMHDANSQEVSTAPPQKDATVANNPEEDVFYPRELDSLFWCFYIMHKGMGGYEMLHNRLLVTEKNAKIDYIEVLRNNRLVVKAAKLGQLSTMESALLNERTIDIKTFMALCYAEGISCVYVSNHCYYEINVDEDDVENIHVITKKMQSGNVAVKYGHSVCSNIDTIRASCMKIDNVVKPLKAMTGYKLDELIAFCHTLHIPVAEKARKKDVYECLVQFFSLF